MPRVSPLSRSFGESSDTNTREFLRDLANSAPACALGVVRFEAILVDAEGLDPRFQRRRWDPKFGGCAGRAGHFASGFGQGRLDRRPFLDRELFSEWATCLLRGHRFGQQPKLVNGKCVRLRNDDRALDHVLELTYVAGPRIRLQEVQTLRADALDFPPCHP